MSVIDRLVALSRRTWKIRRSRLSAGPSWVRAVAREEILCVLLLVVRTIDFLRHFGESIGFDTEPYLEVMRAISWSNPSLGVREFFFSYHPPLNFLLAKSLLVLGFDEVRCIQLVAFAAGIGSFFLLRGALKHLKLLQYPAGLAFLYITSAIPLQFYLQHSINMDATLVFWGALILYCSAALFAPGKARLVRTTLLLSAGIIAAIALGLYSRFTMVLLVPVPLVAAVLLARPGERLRRSAGALLLCAAGMALIFPYYQHRYYRTEGTLFPVNTEWLAQDELTQKRSKRDQDPAAYVTRMFLPSPLHLQHGITVRDYDMPRMLDVWRDFWIREGVFFMEPSVITETIGIVLLVVSTVLCLHGLLVFLWGQRRRPEWRAFGWILLTIGAAFALAMVRLCYLYPAFGSSKGVYVAPLLWPVAYLLAESLTALPHSPFGAAEKNHWSRLALSVFLALFIGMQVMFPAY